MNLRNDESASKSCEVLENLHDLLPNSLLYVCTVLLDARDYRSRLVDVKPRDILPAAQTTIESFQKKEDQNFDTLLAATQTHYTQSLCRHMAKHFV